MSDGMSDLMDAVKKSTIANRNSAIKLYEKYETKDLVLILIETMKKYSQDEDCLTGQYMMTLDAMNTILTKRKIIPKTNTWTLEEFLNGVPFHSDIIESEVSEE